MTVFYRGPYARITDTALVTLRPAHREFAISELASMHIVEVGRQPGDRVTARLYAAGSAGAVILVAWPKIGAVPITVATLIAIVAVSLRTQGCLGSDGHRYELHGDYRGTRQVLFATTDLREFGQVSRALLRAIERSQDTN